MMQNRGESQKEYTGKRESRKEREREGYSTIPL